MQKGVNKIKVHHISVLWNLFFALPKKIGQAFSGHCYNH